MRNKQELMKPKRAFREMNVTILPINESISFQAADYVEEYGLSNSVEMADALIAATCMEEGTKLFTANDKHYKAIEGLHLEVFRP